MSPHLRIVLPVFVCLSICGYFLLIYFRNTLSIDKQLSVSYIGDNTGLKLPFIPKNVFVEFLRNLHEQGVTIMTYAQQIGARIAFLRRLKGLTLAELAERVNKHKSTISKYESGQIIIDIESLKEVARTPWAWTWRRSWRCQTPHGSPQRLSARTIRSALPPHSICTTSTAQCAPGVIGHLPDLPP